MAKNLIKYAVVDAFSHTAFKGNPAAVCWLEGVVKDDKWLQSVATEFNLPMTCYLIPIAAKKPKFQLRYFTPVSEFELCGHATLAASHFLFKKGLVNSNTIEFSTLYGTLTAKRLSVDMIKDSSNEDSFCIEVDMPVVPVSAFDDLEVSAISEMLNGVAS